MVPVAAEPISPPAVALVSDAVGMPVEYDTDTVFPAPSVLPISPPTMADAPELVASPRA